MEEYILMCILTNAQLYHDHCLFRSTCRHSVGDADVPFTLQSVSKCTNYAIAANEYGSEMVGNHTVINSSCIESTNAKLSLY